MIPVAMTLACIIIALTMVAAAYAVHQDRRRRADALLGLAVVESLALMASPFFL